MSSDDSTFNLAGRYTIDPSFHPIDTIDSPSGPVETGHGTIVTFGPQSVRYTYVPTIRNQSGGWDSDGPTEHLDFPLATARQRFFHTGSGEKSKIELTLTGSEGPIAVQFEGDPEPEDGSMNDDICRSAWVMQQYMSRKLRLTKFSGPPGDQWAYDRLLLERLKVKIADQAFNTAMGSLNLSAT